MTSEHTQAWKSA